MYAKIQLKAQSAMEYLMTYGWAILIISVVLASLFSLGVFNAGSALSTTCLPLSGYTCTSPLLHSGTLYITVGQATGISWTNTVYYYDPVGTTGCSLAAFSASGTTVVNSVWNGMTLASGFSNTIDMLGDTTVFPSSPASGASYSGTIWASYNSAGLSNLCVQVATISLKAV